MFVIDISAGQSNGIIMDEFGYRQIELKVLEGHGTMQNCARRVRSKEAQTGDNTDMGKSKSWLILLTN